MLIAVLAMLLINLPSLEAKDAVDYIDPFIGTGHQGKDFPGATIPFSMVKLSPDTGHGGLYYYSDSTIQGFSFTHLGGADGAELGNVLVSATTGPLHTYWNTVDKVHGYSSSFAKSTEHASAGYYAVTLADYQVRAEATAAAHSGMLRFTFPENEQSRIQIDLSHRNGGSSFHQSVKVVNDHTIEGEIQFKEGWGGWTFGGGCHYNVFYHMEFSKPFIKSGVWSATLPPEWQAPSFKMGKTVGINTPSFAEACKNAQVTPDCKEMEGQHIGFYSEFPTKAGDSVEVKAGISFVSLAGARANLTAEIPDWDFDKLHQKARDAWSQEIGRLAVEGGSEDDKTIYYSCALSRFTVPADLWRCRRQLYRR